MKIVISFFNYNDNLSLHNILESFLNDSIDQDLNISVDETIEAQYINNNIPISDNSEIDVITEESIIIDTNTLNEIIILIQISVQPGALVYCNTQLMSKLMLLMKY